MRTLFTREAVNAIYTLQTVRKATLEQQKKNVTKKFFSCAFSLKKLQQIYSFALIPLLSVAAVFRSTR